METNSRFIVSIEGPMLFHHDSASVRQLHHANLLTAQQRMRGTPVSNRGVRWRAPFAAIRTRLQPPSLPTDHELFAGLNRKQLARADVLFEVVEVRTGASLGEQSAPVTGFITILEGQVGVTIDGAPHAVLDDGSQFGALSLLDDDRPTHRASFSVLSPSRIAVVPAECFPTLLEELPPLAEQVHAIVDVRRAYLAGLAAANGGASQMMPSRFVADFPVHVPDRRVAPTRRHVMQVRARTSR